MQSETFLMNIQEISKSISIEFNFEWWSLDPGGGGNSDVSNFSKLISLTNNVPIFLSNFFFQPNMASIMIVALSFGTIYSMLGHPVHIWLSPKKNKKKIHHS